MAILGILLGVMVPSLNPVLGFRVQRTTNSVAAALDRTKTEAMNRLIGEMKLERRQDGYYISYYLHRGKKANVAEEQAEKIAPAGMRITYTSVSDKAGSAPQNKEMSEGDSLTITYDRATGEFLPLQNKVWTQDEIMEELEKGKDIPLTREGRYCKEITISGGFRTRTIQMELDSGSYSIVAG